MSFARQVADHVVLLADGVIIEEGPPEKILDAPGIRTSKKFPQQAGRRS